MCDVKPYPAGLALLLGAFILLAGIYSVVVPPFETPDEIWHFAFIQHVATGQGLPVSAPNTQALWRQQGVQAPLYYLVAAGLTAWIDQSDFPQVYERANPHAAIGRPDATSNRNYLIHHADEDWPWRGSLLALYGARFFSVILGAVTLWATYRTLALLLGADLALLGTALFAFIPQFIFISAAVSNDNGINALAALVLWRLVALLASAFGADETGPRINTDGRGFSPLSALIRAHPRAVLRARCSAFDDSSAFSDGGLVILGSLLGLAVLSKLSALALIALAGLTLLFVAWRLRSWRWLIRSGLAVGFPALTIGGWWYVRNWLLYRDPLAWNVWQANILLRVAPAGWRTITNELTSLDSSFWGLFGWLNVSYPAWVYTAFRGLEIGCALGLLLLVARWIAALARQRLICDWRWAGGGLLLLWLALLGVSWVRFMRIAPAAQGRYFFPAAPAIALLLILGLAGYRTLRVSPRAVAGAGWAIAAGLALLSAVTPFWIIRPAYQPPPPAQTAAAIPVRVELGDRFAILGVAAEPGQLAPGGTADVTIVWQAVAPDSTDYSVFIHLESADGLTIAQADTMPGGGLLPTSQWMPGQTRAERYTVTIPPTAYTPDQGRWAAGLYDHRTGQRLPVRLVSADPALAAGVEAESLRFGAAVVVAAPGTTPNPVQVDFTDNVTLVGYSFSSRSLRPGEPVTVTIYWQARGPVTGDYTAFAHLLDGAYQTFGGQDATPRPRSRAWLPGQIISDTHTFTVAPEASPGLYQVEVGLYTRPDFDRLRLVQAPGAEGADRLLLGPLQVDESKMSP
ncbi:MAG: hypothetical protein NT169_04810 [Chloroflexi bacterium]|nr:hypothetical protein [Chloroflexota bacterium]